MKAFILFVVLCWSCAKNAKWYERCVEHEEISFLDFMELPDMPGTRVISLADTNLVISLSEAYRMRYKMRGSIFIDIKIENSQPGHFGSDLKSLFSYYMYLDSAEADFLNLRHAKFGKYDGLVLTRPDLNQSYKYLSINFFIDYEKERFIYVYYFNLPNDGFDEIDEFIQIRDITLTQIIECLE